MRKVILQMMVSADGYYEGPDHELNWHVIDRETQEYIIAMLDEMDDLLFGRLTYELMVAFWPTDFAMEKDPLVAEKMNSLRKTVFSTALQSVNWDNTRLITDDPVAEVRRMKSLPGKDICILGSSKLTVALMDHGLVDECRLLVNPVALGHGHPVFEGLSHPVKLSLTRSEVFGSGNILLYYAPQKP